MEFEINMQGQNDKQEKIYKKVDSYVFDKENLLGQGSYGKVYSGVDSRTGMQVAVKVIPMTFLQNPVSKAVENLKNEIKNMHLVNHQNIVKLHDVKKSPNNLYLIVEYCNSGSLEKLLQERKGHRLPEHVMLNIMKQIVSGFRVLYESQIVHRDLKPANILFHNEQVKISDFGFSKVVIEGMDQSIMHSQVGSPQYMSPQILNQKQYSSKTDVWSLGMIFFESLYGKTPWSGANPTDLREKIDKYDLIFPDYPIVSDESKKMLRMMLAKQEKERISWEEIFKESLFEEVNDEQINESLKSIELSNKNNFLANSKALSKLYFEQNKVVNSAYDCQKREKINKMFVIRSSDMKSNDGPKDAKDDFDRLDSQSKQNLDTPTQLSQSKKSALPVFANQINVSEAGFNQNLEDKQLQQLFNQQKLDMANKVKIDKIVNLILYRRNLSTFYITLACELYELQVDQKKLEIEISLFHRTIFLLLKYQQIILYKLYKRLKYNDPEKYTKFAKDDWMLFFNSEERTMILSFIKIDLNVSKVFFEEFLKLCKRMLKNQKQQLSKEQQEKMLEMEEILSNKMGQMKLFKQLCQQNMQELNQHLQIYIKNKNIMAKEITSQALFVKMITEKTRHFKFQANGQNMDFQLLYEEIQKMKPETLLNQLYNQN